MHWGLCVCVVGADGDDWQSSWVWYVSLYPVEAGGVPPAGIPLCAAALLPRAAALESAGALAKGDAKCGICNHP